MIDYTQTLLPVADTGWAIPVTAGARTATTRAARCAPLLITLEDTRPLTHNYSCPRSGREFFLEPPFPHARTDALVGYCGLFLQSPKLFRPQSLVCLISGRILLALGYGFFLPSIFIPSLVLFPLLVSFFHPFVPVFRIPRESSFLLSSLSLLLLPASPIEIDYSLPTHS